MIQQPSNTITKDYFDKQIGKFATKAEIRKLATKAEVKVIRNDLLRVEERVENLEDITKDLQKDVRILQGEVKSLREEVKKNTDILIDIAGKLDEMRTENTVGAYQIRELREDVDSLKDRVQKLEKSHRAS